MSEYFHKLQQEHADVAVRYMIKINEIGGIDPLTLTKDQLDDSLESFPSITQIDLVSYLVLTHSYYTKEQLKAYKSLLAYKFFEAGFILECGTKTFDDTIVDVASHLKAVCRTTINKPSLSLLKTICYPVQTPFSNKYTE